MVLSWSQYFRCPDEDPSIIFKTWPICMFFFIFLFFFCRRWIVIKLLVIDLHFFCNLYLPWLNMRFAHLIIIILLLDISLSKNYNTLVQSLLCSILLNIYILKKIRMYWATIFYKFSIFPLTYLREPRSIANLNAIKDGVENLWSNVHSLKIYQTRRDISTLRVSTISYQFVLCLEACF